MRSEGSRDKTVKVWAKQRGLAQPGSTLALHCNFAEEGAEALDCEFAPPAQDFKLAAGFESGVTVVYDLGQPQSRERPFARVSVPQGSVSCLSWCKGEEAAIIALGTGGRGEGAQLQLQLWLVGPAPLKLGELAPQAPDRLGPLHDLAWASLNGRSAHLLAAACDARVFVFNFELGEEHAPRPLRTFVWHTDQRLLVLRVKWNYTATLLAASFSNRTVAVYRWIGDAFIELKKAVG